MSSGWFPEGISEVASQIDRLFWFSSAWTAGAAVLFILILASFITLYHERPGHKAHYTHGNSRSALLLTLILAAVVFVALDLNLAWHDHKVWTSMFGRPPGAGEGLRVQVLAEQFAWNFRYAGADGEFNTADDVATMNELRVPAGRPVVVQIASKDVIHSFFLPNLRIKQDAVPGMITSIYFTADRPGLYNVACAEHCGLGHYRMKGSFFVDAPEEFDAWLAAQPPADSSWGWNWSAGPGAGRVAPKES